MRVISWRIMVQMQTQPSFSAVWAKALEKHCRTNWFSKSFATSVTIPELWRFRRLAFMLIMARQSFEKREAFSNSNTFHNIKYNVTINWFSKKIKKKNKIKMLSKKYKCRFTFTAFGLIQSELHSSHFSYNQGPAVEACQWGGSWTTFRSVTQCLNHYYYDYYLKKVNGDEMMWF